MFTRLQITIALGIAALAWGATLMLQGTAVTLAHLAPFSTVVGVLGIVALVMNQVLWRARWFQGWLFDRPDIHGTWEVTIQPEWIDPNTGNRIPPITAYAGVTQTLTALQIHLMTPESESCLIAHAIEPTVCQSRFQISFVYANTPEGSLRGNRSERHVGAAMITTHGPAKHNPDSMTGEYWTDRKTVGRLDFKGRGPVVHSRYEDAARYFESRAASN